MNLAIGRWALGITFAFMAEAAQAQEEQGRVPSGTIQEEPDPLPAVSLSVGYRFWATSLDFDSRTASEELETRASGLHAIQLLGETGLAESWVARAGVEFAFELESEARILSLGVAHLFADAEEGWEHYASATLLYGTFEMEGAPGEFKDTFGVELGAGLTYSLDPWIKGFAARAELAMRWLEFEFDADPGTIEADEAVGGFGLVLSATLEYRF